MKYAIKMIVLFILLAVPIGSAASISDRESILQLLKEYSPTSYYLIDQYEKTPMESVFGFKIPELETDFMKYIKTDTELTVLCSLNIMVHEMCHAYTSRVGFDLAKKRYGADRIFDGKSYYAIYIGGDSVFQFQNTEVFDAEILASVIPESLITFRFDTYVKKKYKEGAPIGIHEQGVYWYLDEFNAYYHGTKAAIDMYPYYRDKMELNYDNWDHFFLEVNSTYAAYAEFKYYILKYLQYAEVNDPKLAKEIIKNKEFVKAFLAVEANYAQMIADYFKLRETICEDLRKQGCNMVFGSGYQETYDLPYQNLQAEMEKDEYQRILAKLQKSVKK